MKVPTEGELQELENRALRHYRELADADDAYSWADRIVTTLECLIALARDPSQLLQNIPLDDALDRAMQPPRRTEPKLSVVVQPKKNPKR